MSKSKFLKLQEKLLIQQKSAWLSFNDKQKKSIFSFCDKYKEFLNESKTEREATETIIKMAKAKGFKELDSFEKLNPGDSFFYNNRNKSVVLGIMGEELEFNMTGAHIDSPRLDLKPKPFYEDSNLALLKTHYYGGIRKYHWFDIPLAIHGVVIDKTGKKREIKIGESDDDPIFIISDLLPHLARKMEEKSVREMFDAESLNLVIGNMPISKDSSIKEKIKLTALSILYEKYGITEGDFISAEIELVPATKARDIGLDRALISSYGQDDRACSFTTLKAFFNSENKKKTRLAFFYDKEEIGSTGNTGASSLLIERVVETLIKKSGSKKSPNEVISKSIVLSADVVAGLDPSFSGVFDPRNSPLIGGGVAVEKYTGSGGKYGGSDANAEYISFITRVFNENNICWQSSELGKTDVGGGGTIGYLIAKYGCEVLDVGVPVLGMHSPYEISSKVDLYSAYLAYSAFFNDISYKN
ncbi:aminopeptidase [Candidatus Woesearchaeota archaeon]|nr:aminopeptidase [Candidatus Woesearchaeota archaeon]